MYTNNYWLYQGIKLSLKDFDVFHYIDERIDFNQQKMIFVDGNILLEGKSDNFISFIYSNCIDRIVWLTGHDTGMVYPLWAAGDRVININKSRDCFSQVCELRRQNCRWKVLHTTYDFHQQKPLSLTILLRASLSPKSLL